MSPQKRKVFFVTLVFTLIAVYQSWGVLQTARAELPKIRGTLGQSSLWRSANFSQSQKFAEYISFLIEKIPVDARVILPPAEIAPWSLSMTPYMQFYLAPREVVNCASLSSRCDVDFQQSNTYTLIIDDFPGSLFDLDIGKTSMFNDNWGVYQPKNPSATSYTTLPQFQHLVEILSSALVPGFWLIIVMVFGYMLLEILNPDGTFLLNISLGYGLALSAVTLSLSMVSLIGIPLTSVTYWLLPIFLLVLVCAFLYRRARRSPASIAGSETKNHRSKSPAVVFWPLIIVFFAALAILISVGKSFHTTDAILLWGARGYGISANGTIRNVLQWGTSTMPYPLHISLLLSVFKSISGDLLPLSKIIFSGYYLMILLAAYEYLRRTKVARVIAGLAILILALAPLVFNHATIGYANLTMAYYVVCAVMLFERTVKHTKPESRDYSLFLSGLFFVGAAWTRPEGLAISWLVAIALTSIALWIKREKSQLKTFTFIYGLLLIYSLFWMILKPIAYPYPTTNAHIAKDAISSILNGSLHINQIGYILINFIQSVVSLDIWGFLGTATLATLFLSVFRFTQIKWLSQPLLIGGVIYIIAVTGIYYLASYDPSHDISWWVNSGLDRLMMPGVILCWIGSVAAILPQLVKAESDT